MGDALKCAEGGLEGVSEGMWGRATRLTIDSWKREGEGKG